MDKDFVKHNAYMREMERTEEQVKANKRYCQKWYKKNRESHIRNVQEYQKATGYASEKTPEQRKVRVIKRKTRTYFPLKGERCVVCGGKAEEHHFHTNPIAFDRFYFICHKCHFLVDDLVTEVLEKKHENLSIIRRILRWLRLVDL